MKKILGLSLAAVVLAVGGTATAADYQAQVDRCLDAHANKSDSASVTLQCDAQGGKLANCKVLQSTVNGKGFDKAALCVAEFLPMPGKSGSVTIPLRFAGEG